MMYKQETSRFLTSESHYAVITLCIVPMHELEVGPTANYIFQTLLFEVGNIRSWFVNDRSALYAPCVATRTL